MHYMRSVQSTYSQCLCLPSWNQSSLDKSPVFMLSLSSQTVDCNSHKCILETDNQVKVWKWIQLAPQVNRRWEDHPPCLSGPVGGAGLLIELPVLPWLMSASSIGSPKGYGNHCWSSALIICRWAAVCVRPRDFGACYSNAINEARTFRPPIVHRTVAHITPSWVFGFPTLL